MLKELEQKIGYAFHDGALLQNAVTHSSFANESRNRGEQSNERLEFLGDAVLGVIAAEYLYKRNPGVPEGELTRRRAMMVCEKSLSGFSGEIGLSAFLRMGKGEETQHGRERPSILADAFEALVAAIYLDGGLEPARKFVTRFADVFFADRYECFPDDYKTELQEIVQKNHSEKLEYRLTGESGPDHDKQFTVEVYLNSNCIGSGTGRSKKQAEQKAAREALKLMGL